MCKEMSQYKLISRKKNVREMQIEITIRYYFTSVRMTFQKARDTCVGKGVEKINPCTKW